MPRAFRPDPDGLSFVIPSPSAILKMNSGRWREYAIYKIEASLLSNAPQLDPAQQRRGKAPVVRLVEARKEYDPDEWGEDHVSVKGITKGLHEWLRDIAIEERPAGRLRDSVRGE